ncbi:DinB superfamily protein [Fodinibius salinus]|uniref:DinB superfamily protein n=1 Tax=Fodinibius salinus TaxID=860790 RepID=A0A5D3YFQ1_9BACT|nr:DinB family protein [Fodinibius salinus]TYP91938.1 DinB superfamily protein [Fodinibius salinus]
MSLFDWEDNHPQPDEYGTFYRGYIEQVTSSNVLQMLIQQGQETYTLIQQLTPKQASYRYADDKWSVKEVIGHLIDTERIMAYRALCISRGETKSLPGYDQDQYVAQANFEERSLQNLSSEYDTQRNANISLFNNLSEQQIMRKGTANDETVSVRALVYIIAGHERHHLNILEEKYNIDQSTNRSK